MASDSILDTISMGVNTPVVTLDQPGGGDTVENEITINWNAPFAWVAAYLDEHAR